MGKVWERLEPSALDPRTHVGAKLKRTAIVSRSTAAKGERERQTQKEGKTRRSAVAEALLTCCSRCCVRVFIVQLLAIYNLY